MIQWHFWHVQVLFPCPLFLWDVPFLEIKLIRTLLMWLKGSGEIFHFCKTILWVWDEEIRLELFFLKLLLSYVYLKTSSLLENKGSILLFYLIILVCIVLLQLREFSYRVYTCRLLLLLIKYPKIYIKSTQFLLFYFTWVDPQWKRRKSNRKKWHV